MADVRRPDAVLIVHGIGEQISNDTARSLATALADPTQDRVRSAADPSKEGAKQRVYAIVWDVNAPSLSPESRISEGYWAYRFRDTTWSHVTGWLMPLIRRPRGDLPDRLKVGNQWVSRLLVAVTCLASLAIVAAVWAAVPLGGWLADEGLRAAAVILLIALLLGFYVFFPRRPALRSVAIAAVSTAVMMALSSLLFRSLGARGNPEGFTIVAITVLGALILASLAVDVLTSVRVMAVVTAAAALIMIGMATNQDSTAGSVLALLASAAAPWASAMVAALLLPSLGDAARYFRDHPSNEADSRDIRKIVIDKLRALHELDDGEARFERVIVIGHSLGSVIAYDAINHFWSETNGRQTVGGRLDCQTCAKRDLAGLLLEEAANNLVEEATDELPSEEMRELVIAYRRAQWNLGSSLREEPTEGHLQHTKERLERTKESVRSKHEPRWLITDFITMGSPLSSASFLAEPGGDGAFLPEAGRPRLEARSRRDHGDVLSSTNRLQPTTPEGGGANQTIGGDLHQLEPDDVRRPARSWFESKVSAREYPACPPLAQTAASLDPILLFSEYPLRYSQGAQGLPDRRRHLHHAAAFAPTRWTNVYFENDLVGGPISGQLGRGILDLEVPVARPTPRNFLSLFSHSSYWTEPSIGSLQAASETSRQVLIDLVRLEVDRDTYVPIEVNLDQSGVNQAWLDASPGQSVALNRLERLRSRRQIAFGPERREKIWTTTIELLGESDSSGGTEFLDLIKEIRKNYDDRCVALMAYGEVALYRLRDGDLDRSEYRMIKPRPANGSRRCRIVTDDFPWPGRSEQKSFDEMSSWIYEFLDR